MLNKKEVELTNLTRMEELKFYYYLWYLKCSKNFIYWVNVFHFNIKIVTLFITFFVHSNHKLIRDYKEEMIHKQSSEHSSQGKASDSELLLLALLDIKLKKENFANKK